MFGDVLINVVCYATIYPWLWTPQMLIAHNMFEMHTILIIVHVY